MDQTDDAPGVGAPSDASVKSDTHQDTTPVVTIKMPSSSDSPPATTIPNLRDSMLKKKRKATEIQPPMGDCSIGTVNISQQASPEPADQDEVYTPPRNTKKQKVEHESSGQGSPEFSKSDLFLEQDDLTKVRPARTASTPPEGVTAFLDTTIATFSDELSKIESEQTDIPTAPPQPAGGPISHRVGPYDTAAEKKGSSLSIDRPGFGAARRIEETIVDFVLSSVKWLDGTYGEMHDDEIRVFCRKLKAVVAPQKYTQHARSVGLISDPGAGKSLLINNLLNLPGAAISKSSRMSTTNVRHEYINAESQLSAPVVAAIHPFAESSIYSKIRDRVAKVLEFKDYEHRGPGDAFDKSEYDSLKREKATALDYLSSLVVSPDGGSGFHQASSLDDYITESSNNTEQDIVQYLFQCVQDYQLSCTGTQGQITLTAGSISALQSRDDIRRFAGYLKDTSDPRALWRLIEKISMYVRALVLENGLRLNDVPGVDLDTDESRTETGEEAYKDCDIVILLKPYERSSNSRTLMNTFRRCIRDGKDVVLVITHLDSFDNSDDLADEEESDGEIKTLVQLEQDAEQRAEEDDEYDLEELNEIKSLKYRRRIEVRSKSITKDMETVYRQLQLEWNGYEGEKLMVFPVLNKDHSYYVKGYNPNRSQEDRPKIPIKQTGVIQLRTFLRGIPAEMMLRTLRLSKTDLERLLVAIELYCISSKLERKQDIEHHVSEPREDCALEIGETIKALKTETEAILEATISGCKLSWMEQGERLSDEWGSKYHSNYLAFCKRNGIHHTAGKKENWNDAVQKIMLADLVTAFKMVYEMVKRKESELLEHVTALMKNIATSLKGIPKATMFGTLSTS
jgi:hypothetical protein